jgi:hypothetical protein
MGAFEYVYHISNRAVGLAEFEPWSQHVNGGGSLHLPRRKTVEVYLKSGQTVGELVCQYTGAYTQVRVGTFHGWHFSPRLFCR